MAKAEAQQDFELAGVDDGFAYTKVYSAKGGIKIRSMARSGLHPTVSILGEGATDDTAGYETEGLKYTAGDQVEGEDTRFDGYIGSPLNRVVIHHGLHRIGFAGRKMKIATGMPVESFYLPDGKINEPLISKKRESVATHVAPLTGGAGDIEIIGNVVCSEGVAAWLDHVLDLEGKPLCDMNASHPIGIVDIGGRTTDTVLVFPPSNVDRARSGTQNVGVLDVLKAVSNALQAKFDLQNNPPRWALENAVMKGTYRVWGQDEDVSDIVKEAVASVTERIMREVQRRLGNGSELDKVIFVGGGAAMMPGIAESYRNGVIADEPEFANSRGMYKYLRFLTNGK